MLKKHVYLILSLILFTSNVAMAQLKKDAKNRDKKETKTEVSTDSKADSKMDAEPAAKEESENDEALVKLTFGEQKKGEKQNSDIRYIMKGDDGNIYAIVNDNYTKLKKVRSYVEVYSPDLKQIFDEAFEMPQAEGNTLKFTIAMTFNGKPYIFAEYYNKDKGKRFLFSILIQKNGKLGEPNKIAELNCESEATFVYKLSKDSSKLIDLM
jgi:hypothetical protein